MIFHLFAILINRNTSEKEIELIGKIALKEEKALSELYDRYSKLLFSVILKIVKNREDAEEILHTVFLHIWDKAGLFDLNKGNLYSWLITIARNKGIDKIRSRNFKEHYKETGLNKADELELEKKYSLEHNTDLLQIFDSNERASIISKALNELPPEQKRVIELAYFEGLTQAEMSAALNIPLGTVKTRTRQALIKLEDLLSKEL
ncbi:MAG: sigma-70 family RNA polymerase sigma factor [Ignavibacteria bacterium]